jgi:hypothetical protein
MGARQLGQIAPKAIAAAATVVAWPDGRLAYSGRHTNGLNTKGSSSGGIKGRARPMSRLTTVPNTPGSAIAVNKKQVRAPNNAIVSCRYGGDDSPGSAARNIRMKANG